MDNKIFYKRISLSDKLEKSWQGTADLIAAEKNASAVVIGRIKDDYLDVVASSGPYVDDLKDDQAVLKLNGDQYKEILDSKNFTVYSSLKNNMWKNLFTSHKGFAYCAGCSIRWPDESIFGVLYIFHKKKKNYSHNDRKRLLKYRELIETQLKLLAEKIQVKKHKEEKNTIFSVTQKIEKKYKSVFNNITQGLSINEVIFRDQTPADYVVRNYNPAYENLLGLKDLNKIMGKTGSEIYQEDEPSLLESYKEAVYKERNVRFNHYFSRVDKYFEITLTVLGKGKFITIFRDITNARKNNLKLQAANEQLTAYNQEILRMNNELDKSIDELNEMNRRFITMINTISGLKDSAEMSEDEFYSDLLKNALTVVPEADYGKIYVIEDDRCRFVDAVGHDIEVMKNIRLDKELLFHYDTKGVFSTDDYSLDVDKIPDGLKIKFINALKPIKSSLYINISAEQRIVGRISLDIGADSEKEFSQTTKKILHSFATLASSFLAFKKYDSLQDKFTKELISSIIKILEMYDFYTKGHSENVANLSLLIADEMGYSKKIVWDAYWAGMVHDIGKLLIPLQILNKKGKLTDEEYDLIKKHPVWGSKALASSESLKHIAEYILYHHERWDGRGYPEGLKKDEIPVISQIIAVGDAWDAMTSQRSYRDSLTQKEAFVEIKRNKGKQFSPKAVDAFMKIIQDGKLKNGEADISELDFNNNYSLPVNREYFEQLFEETYEGIVILDNMFNILRANKYFARMFGYREKDIISLNIKDVVIPEGKESETKEFIKRLKKGKKIDARTYRKKKGGQIVNVSIQAFPISLEKGRSGYYVIYRDINELKNIEKKYENIKGRYRALFENENTVMLIIDPQSGKIVDANPAAVNFYGWSKNELKKMKITEINTLTEACVKDEMKRAKEKKKFNFYFKHRTARNEIKDVEVYSQPIRFGNKEYLYSIIHDLSYKRIHY